LPDLNKSIYLLTIKINCYISIKDTALRKHSVTESSAQLDTGWSKKWTPEKQYGRPLFRTTLYIANIQRSTLSQHFS